MAKKRALALIGALVLMFSLAAFTPALAAHTAATASPSDDVSAVENPEFVLVAVDYVYTVKNGDNLTRIAKRFNVPLNDLVVARENKNLIYAGEKIHINGLLKVEQRRLDAAADYDIILMTKGRLMQIEEIYKMRIAALETANAWNTRIEFTAIVGLMVLAVALVIVGSMKSKNATRFESASHEEVMESLRELTGSRLVEVMDGTFVHDEVGNPVTLKKVKDFLANDKRARLRELPASMWQEAMGTSHESGANDIQATM